MCWFFIFRSLSLAVFLFFFFLAFAHSTNDRMRCDLKLINFVRLYTYILQESIFFFWTLSFSLHDLFISISFGLFFLLLRHEIPMLRGVPLFVFVCLFVRLLACSFLCFVSSFFFCVMKNKSNKFTCEWSNHYYCLGV